MPTKTLTARGVKHLKPRPGRERDVWWDDAVDASGQLLSPRGLGVRVTASGKRSWVLVYRMGKRRGPKRWLDLGDVAVLGLSDAREKARAKLRMVDDGVDPAAKRRPGAPLPLAGLVMSYVRHREEEDLADKTAGDYARQAKRLAKTSLGKTDASAVTRAGIRDYLEGMAKDAPAYANRLLALIRASCRWAVGRDLLPVDPTAGIKRPGTEARDRRRLDDDELVSLWQALDLPDADLSPQVAAAVRTMLLLGTRRTETCRMRWADVDLDAALPTWTVPAADRKGGRELIVPLPPAVVTILKDLRERNEKQRSFAFAGPRGGPLSSNPNRWAVAVRKACGVEFSPHALRRTFARGMRRLGVSSEMVSRLLGHTLAAGTLEVTENYAEYDSLHERAAALNAWAAHVTRLVSSETQQADVVPIRRA